ncbi:MAG: hypothetical protein HYV08_08160 [Deltaproteobacteria bacterium]|nr:hypothetical protein [Deltaproteobacteria bacterium]MBI3076381.1 hypothetical protein [Deltaproteobacteria bacterium]
MRYKFKIEFICDREITPMHLEEALAERYVTEFIESAESTVGQYTMLLTLKDEAER